MPLSAQRKAEPNASHSLVEIPINAYREPLNVSVSNVSHAQNDILKEVKSVKIIAYLNPTCPYARTVVEFFEQHGLKYENRDIMDNTDHYREMVAKSGQESSPCVEIDGHMLADVEGKEVEAWMKDRGLIG